jgi:hypothetical protein
MLEPAMDLVFRQIIIEQDLNDLELKIKLKEI